MRRAPFALAALLAASLAAPAAAQDLSSIVARAREQVENGAYADAIRTLGTLPPTGVPQALAVEAALLETTAALVTKGADAGQAACGKAIIVSGYDPEVAREQSPKVRNACRAAAVVERPRRLEREKVVVSDLSIEEPEVAWQPVRVGAKASVVPAWLRVVARVTSSSLEGSFDLALAPSVEGPLKGTLDPSWTRPRAKIKIELVPQDKFGDLGPPVATKTFEVSADEAAVAFGDVPSSAALSIDGTAVKPGPSGRVPVTPGAHTVDLVLDDGASASASIDVKRGAVQRVALNPQRAGSSHTGAWIATGGAVVLGAVGGVMLLVAKSRSDQVEELAARREPGTSLPATSYADIKTIDDERKTFSTLGGAFLIGGGVVAAGAAVLWLWPDGQAKKKTTGVRVVPAPGGIVAVGRF